MFTIIITYSKLFRSEAERRLRLPELRGEGGLGKGPEGGKSYKAVCRGSEGSCLLGCQWGNWEGLDGDGVEWCW